MKCRLTHLGRPSNTLNGQRRRDDSHSGTYTPINHLSQREPFTCETLQPKSVVVNQLPCPSTFVFRHKNEPLFEVCNFVLDQHLGFVSNSNMRPQYLWYINLKKGKLVQFCMIHYSDLFNKFHSP